MKKLFWLLIFLTVFSGKVVAQEGGAAVKIFSPEFQNNGMIPKKFTCQGADVSPPLIIEEVPKGAKSLTLIMDDPDAPMGTWDHWIVYDIPVVNEIGEGSIPGTEGLTGWGRTGYGGPCPPSGTHRYFFKLYALDKMLDLKEGASKAEVEAAIQGHILAKTELIGLYRKS